MAETPNQPVKIPPRKLEENLLKNVPVEKPVRTRGFYWSIVLDALAVASALASGYSYDIFLGDHALWPPLFISLSFLFIFSGLENLLFFSFFRRSLTIFLEVLGLLVFLPYSPFYISISAFLLGLLFFLWGESLSRAEAKSSLRIRFFKVVFPQFQKSVTALSLMALIFYLPGLNPGNIFLSQESFQKIYDGTVSFVNGFYPEFNLHSSIGDLARSVAISDVKRNIDLTHLPQSEQAKIISQAEGQILSGFNQGLGITLAPEQPISALIYNFIYTQLKDWYEKFGDFFILFWFLAMYLFIRSFGTIFSWLAALFTFFAYQVLLEFNILKIVGEPTYREAVEFF